MTAYPAWTPAARPGIIPLRPLSFGTILGRSFSALRQNPRVLLGFAVGVQSVATFIGTAAIVAVTVAAYLRLDTLRPGTPEFDEVAAGSIAVSLIAAVVISLALGTLGVLVQGVVVSEVAHAAVAEKLTLGALWARVKPVAWRLIGYTLLVTLVVLVGIALVVVGIIALWAAAPAGGIALTIAVVLAAIPLGLWLTVKLLLAPAAIILEGATITGAIGRSWRLTRGRFWSTLGIVVIIATVFGTVAQLVSIPFSFATTAISTVFAPTGEPQTGAIVALIVGGVLTQIITVLLQTVALIAQSTATSLIYIDCRMRHEGLDQDLLAYVEQRDAGVRELADPYRLHIGRVAGPRAPLPHPGYGYPPPPGPDGYPGYPGYPGYSGSPVPPQAYVPQHVPDGADAAPPERTTPWVQP